MLGHGCVGRIAGGRGGEAYRRRPRLRDVARMTDAGRRGVITGGLMLSMFMISIDTTVINVALPHMMASLSASPDQITWTITSLIMAMAVATPISGWLAARLGLKPMLLLCLAMFTLSSVLCGLATSLPQMVLFRVLQGLTGAPMMPLSQTVLFNINPPERHGRAMALYAMAAMVSPIIGPILGAFLTESLNWRWCFYINVPAGAAGVLLLWISMPNEPLKPRPFDFLGFGSLAIGIAALQLMLDRGTSKDWFSSPEICAEAIVAAGSFWVYLTHTLTAGHPLFDKRVFVDRNFVGATFVSFFTTLLFTSSLTLMPLLMQSVLGYPVLVAGILSIPRGILIMSILQVIGRLDALIDRRLLIAFGLAFVAAGFWMMGHFTLDMAPSTLVIAGLVLAVGQGVLTVPITTLSMTTLPIELRADASTFSSVVRNVGASIGLAALTAMSTLNGQKMHAALAAHVRLDDPVVRDGLPAAISPATTQGALLLNDEITRQATMVAYVDNFRLMALLAACSVPVLLLLRSTRRADALPAATDLH
jgi:DHA2 family multidrug resistance protein